MPSTSDFDIDDVKFRGAYEMPHVDDDVLSFTNTALLRNLMKAGQSRKERIRTLTNPEFRFSFCTYIC